jgi:hypothetical protein
VAESGDRRVWFVAANGLGVEAGVVSEPAHVGGVVQRFVGRETKGGGCVKNELNQRLARDARRCEQSGDVVVERNVRRYRMGTWCVGDGLVLVVGNRESVTGISIGVAHINERGQAKEIAGEIRIVE